MTTEVHRLTVVEAQSSATIVRKRVWSVVAHALLVSASILMLYPLLWMLAASVRPENEIFSSPSIIPSEVSLDAFVRGWEGVRISFSVFFTNSFVIAILAVAGNLVTCSLAAYAFARLQFAGRNFWFAMMLMTLMLPYQVVLIPQYILFRQLPLPELGPEGFQWTWGFGFHLTKGWIDTILPLVVPKFLAVDAFFIFLMVQFFRGIPRELDEAAQMDGCSPWRIYWKIMLPLSLPVMTTAAIFTFIWTWDDFFAPLIYLNEMKQYTVMLGLRTFLDSTGVSDYGGLFAMSVLSLVPIFVFFLAFQRLLIDGIATTGMKR